MKNKSEKFVSSKFILGLILLGFIVLGVLGTMGIILLFSKSSNQLFNFCLSGLIVLIILISFLIESRIIYFVHINAEKITLKTIWGIHSQTQIKDIEKVHVLPFGRGDIQMIYVEDNKLRPLNMLRKNSLIRFQCNKKSIKILKSYYIGEIENLPKKFQ